MSGTTTLTHMTMSKTHHKHSESDSTTVWQCDLSSSNCRIVTALPFADVFTIDVSPQRLECEASLLSFSPPPSSNPPPPKNCGWHALGHCSHDCRATSTTRLKHAMFYSCHSIRIFPCLFASPWKINLRTKGGLGHSQDAVDLEICAARDCCFHVGQPGSRRSHGDGLEVGRQCRGAVGQH